MTSGASDVKQRSKSFDRAMEEQPQAFIRDEEVGRSFTYRLFKLFYHFARKYNDFEILGTEHLPSQGKGALLIGMHSTHNVDIFVAMTGMHEITGRAPRGLMHRVVIRILPFLKYVGLVPGHRHTAKQLLQNGFLTAVLPGGAEEAMWGHERAYDLHPRWSDRRGFAQVAIDGGVDIIPVFLHNVEEMCFNPTIFFCNRIGLTRTFQRLVEWLRTRSPSASKILWNIGFYLWLWVSLFKVPVPVKVTMHLGEPVRVAKSDAAEDVAVRARDALQAMISKHQPTTKEDRYIAGLRERFANQKTA